MAKRRRSEGESHPWLEEAHRSAWSTYEKNEYGERGTEERGRERESARVLFLDAGAGWTSSGVTSHLQQPIHLTHFSLPLVRLSLRTFFKGFGEKA